MIKFDFTYVKNFIDEKEFNELYSKKDEYLEKLNNSDMSGWTKEISKDLVKDITETAEYIKENFDSLVVIGIGGSYLGSYAFNKKNFCINVISKSGTTMETTITYNLLKDLLKRKFTDSEEIRKRIIVTTDKEEGSLREEVNKYGYKSFEIPKNIGGRYSFITPAHLLPIALNHNLKDIVDSYFDGKRYVDNAYEYAVYRYLLFKKKKYIENFCVYEENLLPFTEWLKQLFGETEGKEGKGIYPTSNLHTRDLHSLGQFIQEGNKIIFETYIKEKKSDHFIKYGNENLHDIKNIVLDSVMKAHFMGGTPSIEIVVDDLDEETLSSLIYFFMLTAAFSGFLFNINPFNQPGVEVYKKEVKESLDR